MVCLVFTERTVMSLINVQLSKETKTENVSIVILNLMIQCSVQLPPDYTYLLQQGPRYFALILQSPYQKIQIGILKRSIIQCTYLGNTKYIPTFKCECSTNKHFSSISSIKLSTVLCSREKKENTKC